MRHLVLFDIDGTLLSGGPARDAFQSALIEAFGTAGAIDAHDFSGKTDPQIARELLADVGLSRAEIDQGLPGLFRHYLRELEARLPERPVSVLPGVLRLLDVLEARGDVALGLVTGNIAGGAALKLASGRLETRFKVGGFGSDSEIRDELPPVAVKRARAEWAVAFDAVQTWIVGDTPLDVACARAHGLRTLAVATGRYGAGALRRAGAEQVVPSLRETDAVVATLTGS